MRVLVACEYSGIVRDAFIAWGHDAWSCDIIPTESPGPHILNDVRNVLDAGWDAMIGFPPCTHVASSGARWFPEKEQEQRQAVQFFRTLLYAPIDFICLENPVGILSNEIRKPDQIIQPWMFGEDASKATCLWLKNLPMLYPTEVIIKKRYANQTPSGQNNLGPSEDRAKLRALSYRGIADAMAEQWDFRFPVQRGFWDEWHYNNRRVDSMS